MLCMTNALDFGMQSMPYPDDLQIRKPNLLQPRNTFSNSPTKESRSLGATLATDGLLGAQVSKSA